MNMIIKLAFAVLLCCALLDSASARKLPSYLKKCAADENLDACAIKNANEGWGRIVKGDPQYRIPVLEPLDINELELKNTGTSKAVTLDLTLMDVKLHGLSQGKLVESRMDLKGKHFEWTIEVPRLAFIGKYKVDGKFLILPLQGTGPSNITLDGLKATVKFDFSVEKVKGDDYIKPAKFDISYTITGMYIRLENMFNGDKTLTDSTNDMINENWQEFNKELGPALAGSLAEVVHTIVGSILEVVPYKHVFG